MRAARVGAPRDQEPLVVTDLTECLRIQRRIRLLPNLIDFELAYSVFRPMLGIDALRRAWARLKGTALAIAEGCR